MNIKERRNTMLLSNRLLRFIRRNRGIDTRIAVPRFAKAHNISPQRAYAYLGGLHRRHQVVIITLGPKHSIVF